MNNLENRLCEPTAWEVLELAARYYTEQSQEYTVSELMQVGTEVQIPDRFIQQAIHDLKRNRVFLSFKHKSIIKNQDRAQSRIKNFRLS